MRLVAHGLTIAALAVLAAPRLEAACGCTGMTLNRAGNTGTMCSSQNLNFTECTKQPGGVANGCAATQWAYVCPLGVNDQHLGSSAPYQKAGFKPTATLGMGSALSDCTIGQVLQETITSGTHTEPNPAINPTSVTGVATLAGHTIDVDNNASHQFPQVGATGTGSHPKFGGDDYGSAAAPNVLFNVTPLSVSWWDNPDQTKDQQSEAATWSLRFISFVNGSGGQPSCACAFTIAVTWNGNSAPNTTWTKDNGLSTNCTF